MLSGKWWVLVPAIRMADDSMKIVVGIFALLLAAPLVAQETLVLPPQLNQVAKAHHCSPVVTFVTDEESNQATPFGLRYESHYGPLKTLLAAWCTKDTSKPKGAYTLLIWAEREDQPLRSCPDEIPNVKRIGRPSLDVWPKIPHDFVIMDTGERLSVRETQVMFGVENHLPEGVDYYACVAGRWAHYSPEKN
jgi:hypothetical protein